MNSKTLKLIVVCSLVVFSLWITILKGEASSTADDPTLLSTGIGSPETLQASYDAWASNFEKNGGERNIILPMNASEAIATHQQGVYGMATLNLIDRRVSVEVRGVSPTAELDLWLVDNKAGEGRTVLPEAGDAMVWVGTLKADGGVAKLDAAFSDQEPEGFEPDFIAVTTSGKSPVEDRLLTAETTLF